MYWRHCPRKHSLLCSMPTVNIDVVIMSSHDVSLVNYIICSATSYPACIAAQGRYRKYEYLLSAVIFL